MGRPKKLSDPEALLVAFEVISREGFESFTIEQVAKATRLSPAAVIKRFKTKKRLAELARNQKWDENLGRMSASKIAQLKGLDGIFEFIRLIARSVDSKRLGEHLRWLGTEAEDPKAKKKVASYFEETRAIFARLIHEATLGRELKSDVDPKELAKTLEALVQGSIFQFAFLSQRSIEQHLRGQIQSLLKPLRLAD